MDLLNSQVFLKKLFVRPVAVGAILAVFATAKINLFGLGGFYLNRGNPGTLVTAVAKGLLG